MTPTQDQVPERSKYAQKESSYLQTIPDGKCLSPEFRAFMSRLSCLHVQTFLCSCSDFRVVTRLSCLHVQTVGRLCSDSRALIRHSSFHVQTNLVRTIDYLWLNYFSIVGITQFKCLTAKFLNADIKFVLYQTIYPK